MSQGPPLSRAWTWRCAHLRCWRSLALAVVLYATGSAPSADELRDWGEDLGWAGTIVWPVLFAVVNFVVPWPLLAGATGLVFGTAGRHAAGAAGGAARRQSLQMLLARHLAGPHLRERMLARAPRIDTRARATTACSPSSTAGWCRGYRGAS